MNLRFLTEPRQIIFSLEQVAKGTMASSMHIPPCATVLFPPKDGADSTNSAVHSRPFRDHRRTLSPSLPAMIRKPSCFNS
jgi:hypothetical protein